MRLPVVRYGGRGRGHNIHLGTFGRGLASIQVRGCYKLKRTPPMLGSSHLRHEAGPRHEALCLVLDVRGLDSDAKHSFDVAGLAQWLG